MIAAATTHPARANDDPPIAALAKSLVRTVHAVGAQIYECKANDQAGLVWTFREPIASLVSDDKTVGRHFTGPTWEMTDGSLVVGKVVQTSPGRTSADIAWLKLTVTRHEGRGILDEITTVYRLATKGGNKAGPCAPEGLLVAEPYSADYVFTGP